MGLRPSVFLDFGSVFGVRRPTLTTLADFRDPADGLTKYLCRNSAQGTTQFATRGTDDDGNPVGGYTVCPEGYSSLAPFEERFYGDSWKPRVSIGARSEEHTSELQSLMRISYAVFCLKKKKKQSRWTR